MADENGKYWFINPEGDRFLFLGVNNYLATFTRCVQLNRKEMQVGQIAFLLRRCKGLVQQYLDIMTECESDKNMAYHLEELLRLGTCSNGGEKPDGGPHDD